jgi:hypothetical protein
VYVCVCLGFVVLVFLEESKEWSLAFGDVGGGEEKGAEGGFSGVFFSFLLQPLWLFYPLLMVFSHLYMLVD